MSKRTTRVPADGRWPRRRLSRWVIGCAIVCAVCLVAIPAESAVVAEIHERALISKIDVQADLKQQAQDDAEPKLLHQAELRQQAQAKANAHAEVAAQAANAEEEAKQLDATRADTAPPTSAPNAVPAAATAYTYNVVMGATDRDALQSQVFASTEPVDASAFYGSPWIVWDRTKGGLTFPQNAGAIVHLTGTMTGTYRVDGVLQYIDATTPINQIARGKDLTFQVCDPVLGHNHMHIVGLTRVD